jgi:glycosyltransferase involved in cell wall biosynthesis
MGDKIRIAFFADVLIKDKDGVSVVLHQIADKIDRDRFDILFITASRPKKHKKFPFRIVKVPQITFPLNKDYPIALPFLKNGLVQELDQFKADLVHFTTPFAMGGYAIKYAGMRDLPVITTYHTHFPAYIDYYTRRIKFFRAIIKAYFRRRFRYIYGKCEKVLVTTEEMSKSLTEYGINPEKTMIWGRGVDSIQFDPLKRDSKLVEEFGGEEKLKVIFASRLVWEKDLKTLAKIYKQLSNREDISWIIAGDGTARKYLEKMMPEAQFLGFLNHEELSRVYASCDLFVFPSVTETFGQVVQEAMSSGIVPIVAAEGGPKSIVKDRETGLHAKPKDSSDFVKKILYLKEDTEKRKLLAQNARNYAISQSWQSLVNRLSDLYVRVAN